MHYIIPSENKGDCKSILHKLYWEHGLRIRNIFNKIMSEILIFRQSRKVQTSVYVMDYAAAPYF